MFSVIRIVDTPLRWYQKPFRRFFSQDVTADRLRFDTIPYEMIVFDRVGKPVDWQKISDLLPRGCRLALSRDPLPKGLFQPLDEFPYRKKLMEHMALDVIAQAKIPRHAKTAVVLDDKASYFPLVEKLLMECATVRVVTRQAEEYRRFSDNLLEEYGAGCIVTNQIEAFGDCTLGIMPDGCRITSNFKISAPIFTAGHVEHLQKVVTVEGFSEELPEKKQRQIPAEIQAHDFLAAAYQDTGKLSLYGEIVCRCGPRHLKTEEITSHIEGQYRACHHQRA